MPNCDGLICIVKNVLGSRSLNLQESKALLEILREVERNHSVLPNTRREELKRIALKIANNKQQYVLTKEQKDR